MLEETLISDREGAKAAIGFKMKDLEADLESLELTEWKDPIAYKAMMKHWKALKHYFNGTMSSHATHNQSS